MVTRRSPPMFRVPNSAFRVMVFAHGRSILEGNGFHVHSPNVHTQASCLVRARRSRSPVAQDARSLPCRRVGIHAPTDTGEPRVGVLSKVSETVPDAGETRAGAAQSRARSLGRSRLLRPSFQSPRARARGPYGQRRDHERQACDPKSVCGGEKKAWGRGEVGCVEDSAGDGAEGRQTSLDVQSGADGAGGADMLGAATEVRGLSGAESL